MGCEIGIWDAVSGFDPPVIGYELSAGEMASNVGFGIRVWRPWGTADAILDLWTEVPSRFSCSSCMATDHPRLKVGTVYTMQANMPRVDRLSESETGGQIVWDLREVIITGVPI